MPRKAPNHFWSAWPPASQQRFFKVVLTGTSLAAFSIIVGLSLFSGTLDKQIDEAKAQYGRVVPLVLDIKTLRAQQGDLAHLPVDEAVNRIADDLDIENQLVSMHKTEYREDPAAQVTFEGLALNKLTEFLQALRDRASLQTPECTLTRNPDDPRLADAHFVLAR